MYKGAHLTVWIGKGIPVPPPKFVTDAIQDVQVTNSKDRSGFQISFSMGKRSPLSLALLPAGYFDPIVTRVLVIVTLGGFPHVLMDGLITNHEYAPSNEPGQTTFTITGQDLSLAMDLIEFTIPYPAMPEVARLNLIIGKYAFLGITPLVIPPFIPDVKNLMDGHVTQKNTDLGYIKEMAQKAGFIFFIQPGPIPGKSIAYFGPDINIPIPQAALSINFDTHTNTESISFSLDGLAKKVRLYTIYDPITFKIPIPIPVPNLNVFKPPLGLRLTPPAKIDSATNVAAMSPTAAGKSILGFMMDSANSAAITASGSLDVAQYNHILRARMLVGVRGASITYDGFYYVDSVTHNIKKGEYKQSFTLSRDGLISNTPIVRP